MSGKNDYITIDVQTRAPDSQIPRKTRVAIKPPKLFTNAVAMDITPKKIIVKASHIDPNCFKAKLDGTSKATYYNFVE